MMGDQIRMVAVYHDQKDVVGKGNAAERRSSGQCRPMKNSPPYSRSSIAYSKDAESELTPLTTLY